MEEYPVENSGNIWRWCREIWSMVDGHSSLAKDGFTPNIIPKGKQCIDYSPISKYSTTYEGDASSISVLQDHVSLSETNSDAMSDHTHCNSGLSGLLPRTLGIEDESSVEDTAFYHNKQPSKSRIHRMVQKVALKQNKLLSDQGMKDSTGRYAARHKETSVDASSSCSISKVVVENLELRSRTVNRQMRDLRVVVGCEASSHYINCPCHPPACNRHKRDQSLASRTSKIPFQIENQIPKSEILFPGLNLLADAVEIADAVEKSLQNDESHFPENMTQEKGIIKAISIPRRARSTLKHRQPDSPRMLHALQKDLSAANSKPLLTADNICKLGSPACIKKSENQVVGNGVDEDPMSIPQLRCSKRGRPQRLPSKYCDSVFPPWKRATRR